VREGLNDYYLMEAVDQPWKRATEGTVGAHWGLLNASREAKFSHHGPVRHDPQWKTKAFAASGVGVVAVLLTLLAWPRLKSRARLTLAVLIQGSLSVAIALGTLPLNHYLRAVDAVLLALLVPALAFMLALTLVHAIEFVEMFWWRGQLRKRCEVRPQRAGTPAPFVSIHLPCSNEPSAMVTATIDSLMALDWPAFEVLVVDNNTHDLASTQAVQAHIHAWQQAHPMLASRLRLIHLPTWPGYKAGALNEALRQSDAQAQWVAVVDADYLVHPDWLRQLGGWFEDAEVGCVQSPQAHRDWQGSRMARMMNWEYDGFFRIGMHHRHERNAIIQHGTMTVVRAATLRDVGGWAEDCVCEDSELGVRLLQHGARIVYVDRVMGRGLVPADFAAYARQRRRWAQGGMQILKRHAASLLGFADASTGLTPGQRYHFVAGWLPWVGDALHLVFSLAVMVWSVGLLAAPEVFGWPTVMFAVPLGVYFGARLVLVPLLYSRLVPCSLRDTAGAALAGMALSHSVARGVMAGLFTSRAVFEVTRKATFVTEGQAATASAHTPRAATASLREERLLLLGLAVCAGALLTNAARMDTSLLAWLCILVLQATPYAAALVCQGLSQRKADQRAQTTQAPAA
jgi:cellulose synthase/poly-beta-1,6-N-acetylglucosamine synthase-like glycosyltransferase